MKTTQAQAEEFTKKAIQDYLGACKMESRDDIGNALMKLVRVTGLLMACAEGREISAHRLEDTAAFIRKTGPQFPVKPKSVH